MRGTCTKNKLGALGGAGPKRIAIFFGLLVLATLSVASGVPAMAREGIEGERPNIVLIVADDMRADDFEHMPQTQQLLAEQGLAFDNAFVTHSLCCPSRTSILRGQYTHNHQVINNTLSEGGFHRFRDEGHENSNVATWLKDGGYRTVLLGKYLNHYGEVDPTYVPPGWDEWYGHVGKGEYYDYRLNENGTLVSYGSGEQDYQTDVLAGKAKDYVRRAAGDPSPFFMYLTPAAPHYPLKPAQRHEDEYAGVKAPRPPSFNERDVEDKPAWVRDMTRLSKTKARKRIDRAYRERLRTLLSLDEMVAGLIGELEAIGELDNTYVFFTSDNGFHLGEHRLDKGKRTAYEEALRVPLAIRGPGVAAGAGAEQIALNIDLAPTIAGLAGVPAPAFVDGRSLAPFLSGAPPATWRSAFLIEHWSGGNVAFNEAPTYVGVRTERHKYVEYLTGEKELYDLSSDPYELESLHTSADGELIQNLESRLQALETCAGESCRRAEDGP